MSVTVISLGGSIIAPDSVDIDFLKAFSKELRAYLKEDASRKVILVCGGGAPARIYQQAAKAVAPGIDSSYLDWIGIRATHLNGQLVRTLFADICSDQLVIDPTSKDIEFKGQVLVAGGWKPGFSSDNDAVLLAERFGGKLIINLSNIEKVYTDDPRKNPQAKPIDTISWEDFRKIVGDDWVPGKNTPFDPVASKKAASLGMQVVCSKGTQIQNTMAILRGQAFVGTTIG
ncbi:MAG: UMP kinase [Sphaerochaetaceae bacterium]|nr:UMP kinase [Spirochaetaceae bacterium]MDY6342776.1 UMP kinase [Sphaerochaetaceae bacterium]